MEEQDEEREIKISWWWCTVKFGGLAKSNGFFFSYKI
jgi:hypothetical protein